MDETFARNLVIYKFVKSVVSIGYSTREAMYLVEGAKCNTEEIIAYSGGDYMDTFVGVLNEIWENIDDFLCG